MGIHSTVFNWSISKIGTMSLLNISILFFLLASQLVLTEARVHPRTFGRWKSFGINRSLITANTIDSKTVNPNATNTILDDTKNKMTNKGLNETKPRFIAEKCSCNGAVDSDNQGQCSKESVWCYVDPEAPCSDKEVWLGEIGFGWTFSFEACENQLAEVHKEECEAIQEIFDDKTEDKECKCNGEFDDNFGGECQSPWSGRLWCYVDSVGSGCEDAEVWYGEFGFCQTYSFMACDGVEAYDYGYGDEGVSDYYDEEVLKN